MKHFPHKIKIGDVNNQGIEENNQELLSSTKKPISWIGGNDAIYQISTPWSFMFLISCSMKSLYFCVISCIWTVYIIYCSLSPCLSSCSICNIKENIYNSQERYFSNNVRDTRSSLDRHVLGFSSKLVTMGWILYV